LGVALPVRIHLFRPSVGDQGQGKLYNEVDPGVIQISGQTEKRFDTRPPIRYIIPLSFTAKGRRAPGLIRTGDQMITVEVRGDVEQALRFLKKKLQLDGMKKELKRREYYEKPSDKRRRKSTESKRKLRKLMHRMTRG
jgi:small subunit ribosomal protein S21